MDYTGRPAFNKNINYTPIRKPHINSAGADISSNQPNRSGVLSPNAPEFVPQHYASNNIPENTNNVTKAADDLSGSISTIKLGSSVQSRLNVRPSHPVHQFAQHAMQTNPFLANYEDSRVITMQTSQNRPEEEIRNRADVRQENLNMQTSDITQENSETATEETFAINYIHTIVKCLNDNPGSFDSIASRALSMFEGFGDNNYVLSNAMEIIFNKSIDEQNFRYMGAKLYNLLDLIDLRKDSVFRNLLNLKLTYHQTEVLKYMQNEQFKVRGTTLFLAELYMQLRNDGCQIKEIARNIVFSIKQLLLKTTPENIKCICLTLKLAGYDLEKDCPQDIYEIITNLRDVNALDVSTSRILETVLNLQKNRWGRNVEPLDHSQNTDSIRNTDEPVFYGPDGQILTEEENSFLESNLHDDDNIGDELDSDNELNPEMDAETELAYRDFIRNNLKRKD